MVEYWRAGPTTGGFAADVAAFAFLLTDAIDARWSEMGKKSRCTQDHIEVDRTRRKEVPWDECETRESNDGPAPCTCFIKTWVVAEASWGVGRSVLHAGRFLPKTTTSTHSSAADTPPLVPTTPPTPPWTPPSPSRTPRTPPSPSRTPRTPPSPSRTPRTPPSPSRTPVEDAAAAAVAFVANVDILADTIAAHEVAFAAHKEALAAAEALTSPAAIVVAPAAANEEALEVALDALAQAESMAAHKPALAQLFATFAQLLAERSATLRPRVQALTAPAAPAHPGPQPPSEEPWEDTHANLAYNGDEIKN
ncbi:mucin-7-like [Hordeum vulgare subsp. vulgare]|uniref:mucin-7-like n=1 Tax=Hordeum vulgare subsp. vulgare TaxID=112509 RepID=UPI001D1A38B7|nr:mucin-7-like [Hordeum vulgare subsp. vulgare]